MRVLALEVSGFRGIPYARLVFPERVVLVGPNGSGKSTIVDAFSLLFGRYKLVRELTEHDFIGSCPHPQDRIRIVATLGGFSSSDPNDHPQWFCHGRATERWWNPLTGSVEAVMAGPARELCAQIGFAARFDQEELVTEQRRYFHNDEEIADPFMDDAVQPFPYRLLSQIGFYVVPARRTWPSVISFGSELFRKAIATIGGIPATSILAHRDALRHPAPPLEDDDRIRPLVTNINNRLAQLVPGSPRLQLRVTATDSDSLLHALVPHYQREGGVSLPVDRHGTDLLSLQTLLILLEIGRARAERGESFILALEEPELHVAPGLQRQLIGEAARVSDQVICTTHAPRVASFFDAQAIQILTRVFETNEQGHSGELLEGRPLAPSSMMDEPNPLIQLYTDHRAQLVEALLFPNLLVPEGRIDYEWLRHLLDVAETSEGALCRSRSSIPPFSSVVGVIPTRDAAVRITFERLRSLHPAVAVLLDSDQREDEHLAAILTSDPPPFAIIQWPEGWTIEDAVHWVLAPGEAEILPEIRRRLNHQYATLADLRTALKNDDGRAGGLKAHYMAHEEIAGAIKASALCVGRAEVVLDTLARAVLRQHEGSRHLHLDLRRSRHEVKVYRFQP